MKVDMVRSIKTVLVSIFVLFLDPVSVLNGTNIEHSIGGGGFNKGKKWEEGCQGGSTFVDKRFKPTIEQNTEVPAKNNFTVPSITIKLL